MVNPVLSDLATVRKNRIGRFHRDTRHIHRETGNFPGTRSDVPERIALPVYTRPALVRAGIVPRLRASCGNETSGAGAHAALYGPRIAPLKNICKAFRQNNDNAISFFSQQTDGALRL